MLNDRMKTDFNPTLKQEGLSRRRLLKNLGYGAAGVLAASQLAKPTTINAQTGSLSPGSLFNTSVTDLNGNPITAFGLPAAYSQGMMFLGTTAVDGSGSSYSDVQFIDVNNQSPAYSLSQVLGDYPLPSDPFQLPVTDGLYFYVASGGFVAQCDFTSQPQVIRRFEGIPSGGVQSALTLYNGQLIFISGGVVYSFNTQSLAQNSWTVATGGSGASSVALVGNTLYVQVGSALTAIDLIAQAAKWTVSVPEGVMTYGNGSLFVSSSNGTLSAYSTNGGATQWTYPASSPLTGPLSPPTSYGGSVYLTDRGGLLHRVDALTGAFIWQSDGSVTFDSANAPQIEDGQCYLTTGNGTSALALWSVATDGSSSQQQHINSTGYFIGVENGVVYYTHANVGQQAVQVAAYDFGAQAHAFFCESELMADGYASVNGSATPANASFRTHIQLLDPQGMPRANKSVRVWSSADPTEQVTLISGSVTAQIDSSGAAGSGSVWLTTDSAGELSLVIQANDISCPALYLYGTFMSPGEAIVIYPDDDLRNTLATVSSTTLQSANSYSGNLLPSGYDAGDLAKHINQAFQGSPQVSIHRGKRVPIRPHGKDHRRLRKGLLLGDSPYIAYPGSTPNMTYFADLSGGTERPFQPPTTLTWTLSIDQTTGAAAISNGVGAVLPGTVGSVFSRVKDLEDRVVKGVEKVVSVVVTAATDVVHQITTDAKNVCNVVVNSLEAATASVASVLKTIAAFASDVAGAIVHVAEAFSSFFEWNEILKLKGSIMQTAQGALANVQNWVALQGSNGSYPSISELIGKLSANVASQGTAIIGNTSVQSQQVNGNDPTDVYSLGGGKSYAKSRWFTSQVKENASQATAGSPTAGLGDALDDFTTAVSKIYKDATAAVSSTQIANLKQAASKLGQSITHPSDLVGGGLGPILDTFIEDAVTVLLEFSSGLVTGFFDQIPLLIAGVNSLLTTSISNFPVVGELWLLISGGTLPSFLDIACLMVAIPAFFIQKLSATSNLVGNTAVTVLTIVSGAIYAIIDTVNEVFEEAPAVITGIYLALSVIVFGFSIPTDLGTNPALSYLLWILQAVPIVMVAIGVLLGKSTNQELKLLSDAWDGIYAGTMFGWSVLETILTIFFAIDPSSASSSSRYGRRAQVSSVDGATLADNLFGIIPYFFQFLGNGPTASPSRLVLAGIDFVCDATSIGIQVTQIPQSTVRARLQRA